MSDLTKNEEDYLKALYHLQQEEEVSKVSGRMLATYLEVSSASVSSMIKKLRTKGLVEFEKYGKLSLSQEGMVQAVFLIRKHRLWETFLHKHMNFSWDEVHDVAEQLEHIRSKKLVLELERFLDFPTKDPHGDPIPDADGNVKTVQRLMLSAVPTGVSCRLISVNDSSVAFLQYVSQIGLSLSTQIEVMDHRPFDGSMSIRFADKQENVSRQFAQNLFVERVS